MRLRRLFWGTGEHRITNDARQDNYKGLRAHFYENLMLGMHARQRGLLVLDFLSSGEDEMGKMNERTDGMEWNGLE